MKKLILMLTTLLICPLTQAKTPNAQTSFSLGGAVVVNNQEGLGAQAQATYKIDVTKDQQNYQDVLLVNGSLGKVGSKTIGNLKLQRLSPLDSTSLPSASVGGAVEIYKTTAQNQMTAAEAMLRLNHQNGYSDLVVLPFAVLKDQTQSNLTNFGSGLRLFNQTQITNLLSADLGAQLLLTYGGSNYKEPYSADLIKQKGVGYLVSAQAGVNLKLARHALVRVEGVVEKMDAKVVKTNAPYADPAQANNFGATAMASANVVF